MKQVFIFSLPRSGSTLLQKLLMSHDKISSIAEPWMLLPFAYTLKDKGIKTEYGHQTASKGINNLINNLPNKDEDYLKELKKFVMSLYAKIAAPGSIYFLDKTPRYYQIIPFINRVFPDAKFIFLFRSPLSIMSSYIGAFRDNSIKRFDHFHRDLTQGPTLIANSYNLFKDKSILVTYESLVRNPEKVLNKVFDHLELTWDKSILASFAKQKLIYGSGYYSEAKKYCNITDDPDKWKKTLNNSVRLYILKVG